MKVVDTYAYVPVSRTKGALIREGVTSKRQVTGRHNDKCTYTRDRRVTPEFEPSPDLELFTSAFQSTMFKGILPSRRVPSGDFTIITNLVENQGKENQPTMPSQPRMPTKARSVSKGFLQTGDKKRKAEAKKAKENNQMQDTQISGEAFDKLLVSFPPSCGATSDNQVSG